MARALPECLLLCDVMANYYRGYIEGLREANNGKKMNDCSGVVDTSSRNIMKKNDFETIQENLKTKSSTIQK
nr:hypothetical protein BHI3_12250 [Bacteriovorax sp. HI3]